MWTSYLLRGGTQMERAKIDVPDHLPITKEKVITLFDEYKEQMKRTGAQLGWAYEEAAFPYQIEEVNEHEIFLRGFERHYWGIFLFWDDSSLYIQLHPQSTHGDKGKANEFCKSFGTKLKGKVTLFNGRLMDFSLEKKKRKK
jgi:hypothetical protein